MKCSISLSATDLFYGITTRNPVVLLLFFISFLPQFIDPTYANHYISFLVLGLSFTTTGTLWCLLLALFSSFISAALIKNKKTGNYLTKACGCILVALGIKVALVK